MHLNTLSLGLLLLAPIQSTTPAPTQDVERPGGDTAEDVEVMRRLLVKSMAGGLTQPQTPQAAQRWWNLSTVGDLQNTDLQDWVTSINYNQVLANVGSVGHSSGFHVPGTGVVYSVDLTVPVDHIAVTTQAATAPEEDARDDWSEMEEQVRSGQTEPAGDAWETIDPSMLWAGGFPDSVKVTLDEEAVTRVVDGVLETLARHGKRIEAVQPGESITVCLHLTGNEAAAQHGDWQKLVGDYDGDGLQDLFIANQNLASIYPGAVGERDLERRMVIQLSHGALHALAARGAGAAEAKAHAMVHSY